MKYDTLLEYNQFPLYHSVRRGNIPDLLESEILKIPEPLLTTSQNYLLGNNVKRSCCSPLSSRKIRKLL